MAGSSDGVIADRGAMERDDVRWTAVGRVGAPLVVLAHPTRLSRAFWAPQVDALGDTLRLVAVDLPGHGRLRDEPFDLLGAAGLLRAAIESEQGSRPTIVVGLSLGGYVALALAAEAPQLVDALVLAGCTAEPIGSRARLMRAIATGLGRASPDRQGRLDRLSSAYLRRRHSGPVVEQLLAAGLASRGAAEALRALAGERFLPRLAAYPGPVVLVNGQRDLVMRSGERAFLAAARRGRLVRLRGAYHLSSLEQPERFNAVIHSAATLAARAHAAVPPPGHEPRVSSGPAGR
jgi:pimeloyl-ACP methyl ester carboxylesterase